MEQRMEVQLRLKQLDGKVVSNPNQLDRLTSWHQRFS